MTTNQAHRPTAQYVAAMERRSSNAATPIRSKKHRSRAAENRNWRREYEVA